MRFWLRLMMLAALAAVVMTSQSAAQSYPTKPIKIIVAFAAGGPADVLARVVGQRLTTILGQPIIVENRPGAGGTIGARVAAEAEPDGYTLLLGNTSTLVIAPAVYRNVNYDAVNGFAPIALFGTTSNLLVVHPSFPAKSVAELVAHAKANPGKLNYSSPGTGTPGHLIAETFKQRAGIEIVHVPYKSGGQAAGDVVGGQVQMAFENPTVTLPLHQSGQLRALATTGQLRNPQALAVPTMIESGYPDFVTVAFTGVVAPAGTPANIVARLNAAINESLTSPEVQATFGKLAVEQRVGSPADFAAFLAGERERWGAIIKAAGVRID
jgi:tripartite-type tricarboxylate transporter receptor subunit TctC